MNWYLLLTHATLATFDDHGLGLRENAALACQDDRIVWIGSTDELTPEAIAQADETHNLGGQLVTPGLIDCHTHLVFGSQRAHEFDLRLQGASYEEIAKAGGGIMSSVHATREASDESLFAQAL